MKQQEISPVVERIKLIMDYFGFNQSAMAKAIGVMQPNLSSILSGRRKCEEAVINKVVIALGVDKDWLTTGEGKMFPEYKALVDIRNNEQSFNSNADDIIRRLTDIIKSQEDRITFLTNRLLGL